MRKHVTLLCSAGVALGVGMPSATMAATTGTQSYVANLTELNGSGVSGTVKFIADWTAKTLNVMANISGLAPSLTHINHVHGRFDDNGNPINSVVPTLADDQNGDGDGYIEVLEAVGSYGDILLSLEDQSDGLHNGPTADANGNLMYDMTFDLTDDSLFYSPVTMTDYTSDDLFPLTKREYVIHGGFVPAGINGNVPDGGYVATLPVAAAEITAAPVPVPAAGLLLAGGLGGLAAMRRRRRKSA